MPQESSKDARPAEPRPASGPMVVGIGASAGGLAALKTFFSHVDERSGFAFVVVMHLSPEHESHLAELLQPLIGIPVDQVGEAVALEPDRVYVIPPNAHLNTIDTHLRLSPLEEERSQRAPIDHFFRTLARTHGSRSIGVVLTGTGSDGALGLKEIAERGGLTIAQSPVEAEFDSMPQAAIATGVVDLVLPLEEIPLAIRDFGATRPRIQVQGERLADEARQVLQEIFVQLRNRTGRDFSRYKRSTLLRRIARRMQLQHIEDLGAYLELLRDRPEETIALADEMLVTVTSFFRDPEVFDLIEREVLPQLLAGKGPGDELRVWSVGCATGEEAYSLAMLLAEAVPGADAGPTVQVFASDLHERSLERARQGFYTGDIETDVRPERLKRFFRRENGGYRVRRELRERVVFAPHNLLSDPPFSRVDLLVCRNLLIYLQRDVQRDIVELFHYALCADGFLVLGSSEAVEGGELFRTVDKSCRIYRKRNVPRPEPRLPVFPLTRAIDAPEGRPARRTGAPSAYGALHQVMVERYAAPSLLLNADDVVVHLSEHAGRYLVLPGGELASKVFELVREELRVGLRTALRSARELQRPVVSRPIALRSNGGSRLVRLQVRPSLEQDHEGYVLVIFDEHEAERTSAGGAEGSGGPEDEVDHNGDGVQAILDAYESNKQEMRAANEELQSVNEELRSMMEELETSKEELQSMNEELQALNQENRHKVEELELLSTDLANLLVATDIATLFLDRELRVLRFTAKTGDLFNLRATDRGRPLSDITHQLRYEELREDAAQVLEHLAPVVREVRDEQGRWYIARVLPYRSSEDRILGVVITFLEITDRRLAEDQLRVSRDYAEQILATLPDPLLVLDADLNVQSTNDAFARHFRLPRERMLGRKVYELDDGQWDIPALRRLLEEVIPSDHHFEDLEVEHHFRSLGTRVLLFNGRRLERSQLILLGIHDITERHQVEQALRQSEERLRRLISIAGVGVLLFDGEGKLVDANRTFLEMSGYDRGQVEGRELSWRSLTAPEYVQSIAAQFEMLRAGGRVGPCEKEYVRRDGSRSWILYAGAGLGDGTVAEYCIDIADRKRAEETLQQSDKLKDEFLATLSHELRNPLTPLCTGMELLKSADSAEEVEEVRQMMERQLGQLVRLVDDLLDVSRISRGKIELRLGPTDLGQVVRASIETSGPLLRGAGLQLSLELPAEPLIVQADAVRLAQVLSNILANAAKYSQARGHAWLEAHREGDRAVVTVRDDGLGMTRHTLEHLFELFTQGEQGEGRAASGLGVGLSLSKRLIELHGGTIEAASEGPGRGSTFTLRLPLARDPLEEAPREPAPERARAPLSILVVDDNADTTGGLSRLLRMAGHEVHIAGDGAQALEVAQVQRPDVVLLDLGLPRLDGYEVAQRIRNSSWGADTILIAVTGWGDTGSRRRTSEAGFDRHMVKPIDLGELQRVVGELLVARRPPAKG